MLKYNLTKLTLKHGLHFLCKTFNVKYAFWLLYIQDYYSLPRNWFVIMKFILFIIHNSNQMPLAQLLISSIQTD